MRVSKGPGRKVARFACSVPMMLRDAMLRIAPQHDKKPRHPEERTQCASRRAPVGGRRARGKGCTLRVLRFDDASRRDASHRSSA